MGVLTAIISFFRWVGIKNVLIIILGAVVFFFLKDRFFTPSQKQVEVTSLFQKVEYVEELKLVSYYYEEIVAIGTSDRLQQLVDHAVKLEDKEEKNKMVLAIVDVMGQLNPHLRDVPDFTHKLWDHVMIMSDFKLEVDSPYPTPKKEQFEEKPNKMPYPENNIRFKHYGRGTEKLIEKAIETNRT